MTKRGFALIGAVALAAACGGDDDAVLERRVVATARPAAEAVSPRFLRRFHPLPEHGFGGTVEDDAKVALGKRLYGEKKLSLDEQLSCASCHDLARYGTDGEARSKGRNGVRTKRNAPTTFNAAGAFTQLWDGGAATLEDQLRTPLFDPDEMAMPSEDAVVARLRALPEYVPLFGAAFPTDPDPFTYVNVTRALAAFERKLVTPSRWDRYLDGDEGALGAPEKAGLRVFLHVGCMVCHTGPLLGGTSFQRLGAVEPWPNQSDVGRMSVTGSQADRMMFKVPTLRNVAETAPYFHDGSSTTLPDAVLRMGRHELGIELSPAEIDAIVTFLRALTGPPPAIAR